MGGEVFEGGASTDFLPKTGLSGLDKDMGASLLDFWRGGNRAVVIQESPLGIWILVLEFSLILICRVTLGESFRL